MRPPLSAVKLQGSGGISFAALRMKFGFGKTEAEGSHPRRIKMIDLVYFVVSFVFLNVLAFANLYYARHPAGAEMLLGKIYSSHEWRGRKPTTAEGLANKLGSFRSDALRALWSYLFGLVLYGLYAVMALCVSALVVAICLNQMFGAELGTYDTMIRSLIWSLLDTLTFDMFNVLGIQAMPENLDWPARVLIWYFCMVNAPILLGVATSLLLGVLVLPAVFLAPKRLMKRVEDSQYDYTG